MFWRRRRQRELNDARAEARRWYERLGGQISNLPAGDTPPTRQAMVDAAERYNAAGSQLEAAESVRQFELARETALEGLAYIRAARTAMGLDPGPELPLLAAQRGVGRITEERELDVSGRHYKASPQPAGDTPYYYPGGRVRGRPVPAGWYSEPWWRTALVAGAWGVGSVLVFDALFSGFGESGHDQGFADGLDYADQHGWDPGGEAGGGDYAAGDFGGGDFGF
jgi:hypothetical protein